MKSKRLSHPLAFCTFPQCVIPAFVTLFGNASVHTHVHAQAFASKAATLNCEYDM